MLDLSNLGYKKWPGAGGKQYAVLWQRRLIDRGEDDRCYLNFEENDWWAEFPHARGKRMPQYSVEVYCQVDNDEMARRMSWWAFRQNITPELVGQIEQEAMEFYEKHYRAPVED